MVNDLLEGKVIVNTASGKSLGINLRKVKKRYELVKEPKQWVSMRMKRVLGSGEISILVFYWHRFLRKFID